ncbi:MAG TPA: TlpA disulfide reductase family protein [Thermoleophilaceae bacterium]|jgi:cytochrome c biogenesis protein CcmG/thiol:disulfide interchange protein DsbE
MSRRRLPVVIAVLLVAALVAVELATSGGSDGGGARRARRAAPALPPAVLTPPRATLASLRGRPAIVNFWASWCGPCDREAPELARLSRRLRGRATLVGVDWNDALAGARRFIRRNRWTFPNLRDPDGTVGNDYRLSGLPNSFVLDREGRIARVLIGPQTVASFERALESVE